MSNLDGAASVIGDDFVQLPSGRTYLNTAAEGLPIRRAGEALHRVVEAKRNGSRGRETLYAGELACRQVAANLLAAKLDEVAMVPNVSTGIERFVNAFSWSVGDEVILNDLEFPSNIAPWLVAQQRYGIRVKVLRTSGGVLDPQNVADAITERTRVLSVSAVSYKSGGRFDLAALAAVARSRGVLVCLDATQALGAVQLPDAVWDVLWCSGYKWLLGLHGIALMAVREEVREKLLGGAPGWRSTPDPFERDRFERVSWSADATRFQAGMPSYATIFVLQEALEMLEDIGIGRIEAHLRTLSERLLTGLKALGIDCLTPALPELRAGILAFETPDFARIAEGLEADGIDIWAKDGRVRISFHGYNTVADIDACLNALDRTIKFPVPGLARRADS